MKHDDEINHNVVAYRTDGIGYSNVSWAMGPDQNRAIQVADDLNRGSLYIMGADKPGADRAIPDAIYATGYGPKVLDDEGALLSPYNGELSASTRELQNLVAERVAKFGADGVVSFSAFEASQKLAQANIFAVLQQAETEAKKPAQAVRTLPAQNL